MIELSRQLREIDRALLQELEARPTFPPDWDSMGDLARVADDTIDAFRDARRVRAEDSVLTRARAALDDAAQTDRLEYLDRDDVPQRVRHRLVRRLHRFNRLLMSYRRFLGVLQPVIEAVSLREQRPARVLELGSGSGAFALALAKLATRRQLPVEITGSDVVDRYIDSANVEASRRGLPVRFRHINAFDMANAVTPGDFDVVFIAQSTHHFSPGQVAKMVAQTRGICARRFVSIDGQRNWWSMAFAPLAGAVVTRDRRLVHDASISTRRFYADAELRILARIAAPQAQVEVRALNPGFTVLDVRF